MTEEELEYVGFWARVAASVLDSLLLLVVICPLLLWAYGWSYFDSEQMLQGPVDLLLSWVLPALAILAFWWKRQATPGKDAINARIVDARTGEAPSMWQLVIRYLGYFVSTIPFCLGLIWVAFDARKQGWHDKMAGTVVVRRKRRPVPVVFGD